MRLNAKIFESHRAPWLVAVSVLLFFGALLAYFVQREGQLTLERERDRLLTQTRVIEANLAQQLAGMQAAITSMRPAGPISHADRELNRERSARLKVLADAVPAMRTMLMIDQHGKVQSSNRPETLGFDASERAYFITAKRERNAQALYVSPPFKTALNVYGLNLVKVWVDDKRDELLGLTTATLNPDYFKVLLNSVLYADDMRATLIHADGLAFLTVPANEAIQGSNLNKPGTFFTKHLASGQAETFVRGEVRLTGDQRMVVYRTVSPPSLHMDKPLFLAVSRELGAVLAPWRYLTWLLGAIYAAVCVLTLTGVYLLSRKQRAFVELKRARAQDARDQAERLELALAGGDLGLIDIELLSGIRHVNAQAQAIVGDGPADPVDTMSEWAVRIHPDDQAHARATRLAHQQGVTDAMDMEYRVKHKDGHWVWVHSRGRVTLRDADGTPLRIVGTYQDISERKAAQALIAELAFYDALTNLPNRRLLMDRLSQAQRTTARNGRPAALLFMDLDRFKWVNDTLGHDMGDLLLQEVAKRLVSCVRKSDTVARLGGDEFVLLLNELGDTTDAARAHATRAAEKVLSSLSAPVMLGEKAHEVTGSIGIAIFVGETQTPAQVLKDADQALYLAKSAGRNQAAVYSAPAA